MRGWPPSSPDNLRIHECHRPVMTASSCNLLMDVTDPQTEKVWRPLFYIKAYTHGTPGDPVLSYKQRQKHSNSRGKKAIATAMATPRQLITTAKHSISCNDALYWPSMEGSDQYEMTVGTLQLISPNKPCYSSHLMPQCGACRNPVSLSAHPCKCLTVEKMQSPSAGAPVTWSILKRQRTGREWKTPSWSPSLGQRKLKQPDYISHGMSSESQTQDSQILVIVPLMCLRTLHNRQTRIACNFSLLTSK